MGGLAQEFAGFQVEDAFVRGAAVAPDQIAAGGQAVAVGGLPQLLVIGLLRRVEDDRHVHHNVDEEALVGDKGAQVVALFLETLGESLAGLDDDRVFLLFAGQVVPAFPGGEEQKAEIVDIEVGLAVFQQAGVVLGLLRGNTRRR